MSPHLYHACARLWSARQLYSAANGSHGGARGALDAVDEAQRELDDFFGAQHCSPEAQGPFDSLAGLRANPPAAGSPPPRTAALAQARGAAVPTCNLQSVLEERTIKLAPVRVGGDAAAECQTDILGERVSDLARERDNDGARASTSGLLQGWQRFEGSLSGAGGDGGTGPTPQLTHVDESGKASMVNVGEKGDSARAAAASACVLLGREAFGLVARNQIAKGDVLTTAKLAGIMGAKHTSLLVPLCHNIFLSRVDVRLQLDAARCAIRVVSEAHTVGKTGVEMEALTAAAVAALTVYDMCKAVTKDIVITDLQLESKSGGKSGDFQRTHAA